MQCPVHRGVGISCPLCTTERLLVDQALAGLYRVGGWRAVVDAGAYRPPPRDDFLKEHNDGTPWLYEPDTLHWRDGDYECAMLRGAMYGLNGYMKVPKGHVWDLLANAAVSNPRVDDDGFERGRNGYDAIECDVHGGLTFWGEPLGLTGYWFGFDTGHGGDLGVQVFPGIKGLGQFAGFDGTYRTFEYVRHEIESMVIQATLAEHEKFKRKD